MTREYTSLLAPDEPEAFELINGQGGSNLLLVCDHASNRVPARLSNLGLDEEDLASHIGWDPGAARLARRLSVQLDAPLVMSRYSRLVIDCNRPPDHPESIPVSVAGILIPGNAAVSAEEALQRRQALFDPYHQTISDLLDSRRDSPTRLLSIHSFTPSLLGAERPWMLGVCYRLHAGWAACWLDALRSRTTSCIGDNEPYRVEEDIDFTIPVQGESRGIPSLMLEVRQDELTDESAIASWSELISQSWGSICGAC